MDGSRFDGITRALATGQTRRRALHALTGGALAGLLGLAGGEDAAAAKCAGKRKKCGANCVNTKKDDKHCGGCNKRCKGQNTCKNGKCTSKLGCKAGFNICNETKPIKDLDDPRVCGGNGSPTGLCLCVTDVSGVARCSTVIDGECSNCKKNADCDPGFVCIDASGPGCDCPKPGDPGTGNACVPATCQGVTGSSAGRGRPILKTPLLR